MTATKQHLSPSLYQWRAGLALASGGIAAFVGLSWTFGAWRITTFGENYVPMAPSTVLFFILLSGALMVGTQWPANTFSRIFVYSAIALVLGNGLLLGWQQMAGYPSLIEPWLVHTQEMVEGIPVGRMAPLTALAFLLASSALLFQLPPFSLKKRFINLSGGLAAAVTAIGLMVVIGYTAGMPFLYGLQVVPMSFLTGLALALLGLSLWLPAGVLWWTYLIPADELLLKAPEAHQRFERTMLAVLLSLGAAIGLTGFFVLRHQQAGLRQNAHNELNAIADLKADQILNWRKERLNDALFFSRVPAYSKAVAGFLASPANAQARQELGEWLTLIKAGDRYEQIALFDGRLQERLALAPWTEAPGTNLRAGLEQVRQTRQIWNSDLQRGETSGKVRYDLLFPVTNRVSSGPADGPLELVAIVLFRIDPERFLFPLLRAWPTPSLSGETILVRREGEEVVYLNELRHRTNAALNLRFPLNQPNLPAAMALRGQVGLVAGRDYRGIPVITAFRRISDSPWLLGVKVDQAEIYAAMRYQALTLGTIVASLFLAAMLGVTLLGRGHYAGFMARELTSERERQALAERLALITRYANDIIFLADGKEQIVEANERAIAAYGYSLAELRTMTLPQLRSLHTQRDFQRDKDLLSRDERALIETIHQRKNGSEFPVEVNARVLRINGAPHVVGIVRDITERKNNENRLQQLIEAIQKLAMARDLNAVMACVRYAARHLTGADGATFVLRDGDYCFYADEDAISPLWKGQRFPLQTCISGWVMLHGQTVVIPDIYQDPRIPAEAYRPTFVKSLAMVPIGGPEPLGAIGNYWQSHYTPNWEELRLLQTLADAAAISLENVRLYADLERKVKARTTQLEAANKELEAFSYSVSHDLRAPLRAVNGFAGLLADEHASHLDPEGLRILGLVQAETRRMSQLVHDLLEFSRQSRRPLSSSIIDMTALAKEVFETHAGALQGRMIQLKMEPLLPAWGDLALIRQVWVNLVSNALKYSQPKPQTEIEIGNAPGESERVYFVKDNGVGFNVKYAHKLFGVFQRLHAAEEFEGTGVGLALVQRIIHRHGGRVWAESKLNEGAVFYFSLPGMNPDAL